MTASNSCFGRSHFTPLATIRLFLVALVATQYNVPWATGQLCAQLSGVNFTENFNTLSSTGSNNTSSSVPSEFAFVESPGNLTYAADNGSNATADTYSYGATGSSDRALGELTSAASVSTIGACFVNNTNHAFTSFLIGYAGEEWRLGVADATIDRLDFQYSTDASSLLSGTYINVDALDFTTPSNTGAGAKDGNAAANRTVFAPFAITFFSPLQPERTFYIRWLATNISGANDGLAIDDFSIGTTLGPGVAGDYNNNGAVDAADYIIWRNRLNQATSIPNDITPGTVVAQDYLEWQQRFSKTSSDFASSTNVPEPGSCLYVTVVAAFLLLRIRQVTLALPVLFLPGPCTRPLLSDPQHQRPGQRSLWHLATRCAALMPHCILRLHPLGYWHKTASVKCAQGSGIISVGRFAVCRRIVWRKAIKRLTTSKGNSRSTALVGAILLGAAGPG
jgi:hypothetical protein